MVEEEIISYDEYNKRLDILKDRIPPSHDYIISLTNGGNVLASDLSQYFDIPIMYFDPKKVYEKYVNYLSYPAYYRRPKELKLPKNKTPLIVDEIIDSGSTIKNVNEMLPDNDVAVLYTKYPDLCTYYGEQIDISYHWIVFPWELPDWS